MKKKRPEATVKTVKFVDISKDEAVVYLLREGVISFTVNLTGDNVYSGQVIYREKEEDAK